MRVMLVERKPYFWSICWKFKKVASPVAVSNVLAMRYRRLRALWNLTETLTERANGWKWPLKVVAILVNKGEKKDQILLALKNALRGKLSCRIRILVREIQTWMSLGHTLLGEEMTVIGMYSSRYYGIQFIVLQKEGGGGFCCDGKGLVKEAVYVSR